VIALNDNKFKLRIEIDAAWCNTNIKLRWDFKWKS
jgi:hypothetical protein